MLKGSLFDRGVVGPVDSCSRVSDSWRAKVMRRAGSDFKLAVRLLEKGKAVEALVLAQQLVASPDEDARIDGFMCLGYLYEQGGADMEPDFDKSLDSYRRASLIAPHGITFLDLARISLKRKDFPAALRFLDISAGYEITPETQLGYGQYFEEVIPPDAEKAKSHFARAALRGRFAGFFGYSRIARASGQHGRAMLMDCARIAAGPFIALAIGVRAQYRF